MKTLCGFFLAMLMAMSSTVFAQETLTVSFKTTTANGSYAPKNIVAVWISKDSDNSFVKTIGRWANTRKRELVEWYSAAGSTDADAVSGATRANHTATLSTQSWDMKNKSGVVVADGVYRINFLMTESNGSTTKNRLTLTFNKNGVASSQGPISQSGYLNVTVTYSGRSATQTPTATPAPTTAPPTASPTVSLTPSPSSTAIPPTASPSLTASPSPSPSPSASLSPTPSPASSPSPSLTPSPSPSISPSPSPSKTPVPTLSPSATPLPAAPELKILGSLGGDARAVAASGSTLFLGEGAVLALFQASASASPALLSRIRTKDVIRHLAISPGYVWAAQGGAGIQAIDISDPSKPWVALAVSTQGFAYRLSIAGSLMASADGQGGWALHDISTPRSAALKSRILLQGPVRDVVIASTTAYVLDEFSGLHIYNISNPAAPAEVGAQPIQLGEALTVAGGLAVVADRFAALHAIDVSNPAAPAIKSTYTLPTDALGLASNGALVYVAQGGSGLQIMDYSTPTWPLHVPGSLNIASEARAIALHPTAPQALIACGSAGVVIADISMTSGPVEMYRIEDAARPLAIDLAGDSAFSADVLDRILGVNVSAPASMIRLKALAPGGTPYDVAVAGNRAYVAAGSAGLQILDIQNPSNPTLAGSLSLARPVTSVDSDGQYALAADGSSVYLVDVSTPSAPVQKSKWDASAWVFGVTLRGSRGYVAEGGAGVRILNFSIPTSLTPEGRLDTPGMANDVAISSEGTIAYIADGLGGLVTADISNPANPTLLGSHPVPGVASGVTLADGRAYVADAFGGIQVFDVTNPELPVRVAASNAPVRAWSSAIGATGLFAADSEGGLIAFDAANFTPLANNLWLFH